MLDYPAAVIPPAQPCDMLQGFWGLSRRKEVTGSGLDCTAFTHHTGWVTKLFHEQQAERGNGSLNSAQYKLHAGHLVTVL